MGTVATTVGVGACAVGSAVGEGWRTWQGTRVAEVAIDDAPEEDRMFLERVAVLVSGHCLVGWDTGGESWEP